MTVLVTGGAGFIGSEVVRQLIRDGETVVNVDALTYAGNPDSLRDVSASDRYRFECADVADHVAMQAIFSRHAPTAVIHLAAESHVDRSIDSPGAFVHTNVLGTATLLQIALRHWSNLPTESRAAFRFLHVSTDEVYGSLGTTGCFTEETPYRPTSPYSASKAASDHLVRAWHHTYGFPALISNCSNNYGPFQFPEKLIPLTILNAIESRELPVYGTGQNVRDWLHVSDHVRALRRILQAGRVGQTYNVGGRCERTNLDVVRTICEVMDAMAPMNSPHAKLIRFVQDRPGHDLRYAIDAEKLETELGWRPRMSFSDGLRETVSWYLENRWWWQRIRDGRYRGERLGVTTPLTETAA